MGAKVTVTAGNGTAGAVETYTITDTTTPTSMVNLVNEVPSVSMDLEPVDGSVLLNQNSITVSNGDIGDFYATVDQVSDGIPVHIEAVGLLGPLNFEIVAPAVGAPNTLSNAYSTYIGLAYSAPPTIVYLASSNPVVNYPAFGGPGQGTLWEFLKQLGAITHTQITEVGNTIVIKDMATTASHSTLSLTNLVGDDVVREVKTPSSALYTTITQTNAKTVSSFAGTIFNYSTNPSVETNATGWNATPTSGTPFIGTVTAQARSTLKHSSGSAAFQATMTENVIGTLPGYDHYASPTFSQTVSVITLLTGTPIFASMALLNSSVPSTSSNTTISLQWLDAGNNVLKTTNNTGPTPNSTTFVTVSVSDTVPAGAVNCAVSATIGNYYHSASGTALTGLLFYADALLFTNAGSSAFFDGNTAGASWVGTTNNSVSSQVGSSGNTAFYDAYADGNNIMSVASGQTPTVTLVQTTNYPSALQQPSYALSLPISVGQYSVNDSNGLTLTAAQWLAVAPNPTVATTAIPGQLAITFTGPAQDISGTVGPYSLAANLGFGNNAAFSVAGIGVATTPTTSTMFTGADQTKTQNTTPVDLSSPFIQNSTDTYTVYVDSMADLAGPNITASFSLPESSALGLGATPGATATYKYGIYRALSTSVQDGIVGVIALPYLKDTDFDAIWGNTGSILDTLFDATWGSGKYTSNDFGVQPLWR